MERSTSGQRLAEATGHEPPGAARISVMRVFPVLAALLLLAWGVFGDPSGGIGRAGRRFGAAGEASLRTAGGAVEGDAITATPDADAGVWGLRGDPAGRGEEGEAASGTAGGAVAVEGGGGEEVAPTPVAGAGAGAGPKARLDGGGAAMLADGSPPKSIVLIANGKGALSSKLMGDAVDRMDMAWSSPNTITTPHALVV